MSDSDWLVRPYEACDEGFVVESWLRSHERSHYGRRMVAAGRSYWDAHRPVVLRLLERAAITVLCVPEATPVIIAWSATEGGDVLHYALCKRSVHRAGLAAAAFGQLLGDRLGREQLVSHEQMDLRDEERIVLPSSWLPAPYVLAERAA